MPSKRARSAKNAIISTEPAAAKRSGAGAPASARWTTRLRTVAAAALAGGGQWLHVDVSDSGEGIPPESLPRIFEPQFSTRSSGTGLGLAIVKRLVEAWGGEVTVDSTPGEGTTVHLRLRVVEGAGKG